MQHQITHDPAFSMLKVDLGPNDTLVAEPGAMVAMSRFVQMEAKLNASKGAGFFDKVKAVFAAAVRKLLGGESFFVNYFQTSQPGSVWLAPTMSGSIVHRRLENSMITLSSGAYIASVGDLDVDVKYGGIQGLLAKEGLFFLEVRGTGELFFNSFGGVEAVDVHGSYIVDNGHIVGWEGDLTYKITSAGGGLMGFVASGEGAVCEFSGQGRLYIQSRNMGSLVSWLTPLLPR